MPIRLCRQAGCPNQATYRGYCAEHSRRRERQVRSPEAKKVYGSNRWKYLRRAKLNRDPVCEQCDRRLATDVHHKVDISAGGDPWEPDGLESLCRECHSRVTRARQAV